LKSFVVFEKDKGANMANLSRVSPNDVCTKPSGVNNVNKGEFFYLRGKQKPAQCVSLGLLHSDKTGNAQMLGNGKLQKKVEIKLFSLEAERLIALICSLMHDNDIGGPLGNKAFSLVTRQALPSSSFASPSSSRWQPRVALCTSSVIVSPIKPTPLKPQRVAVLGPEDKGTVHCPHLVGISLLILSIVPIYDGTDPSTSLEDIVKSVHSLPPFHGPIPRDSVVWAGYAVSPYKQQSMSKVSFNVNWVVVLCNSE